MQLCMAQAPPSALHSRDARLDNKRLNHCQRTRSRTPGASTLESMELRLSTFFTSSGESTTLTSGCCLANTVSLSTHAAGTQQSASCSRLGPCAE